MTSTIIHHLNDPFNESNFIIVEPFHIRNWFPGDGSIYFLPSSSFTCHIFPFLTRTNPLLFIAAAGQISTFCIAKRNPLKSQSYLRVELGFTSYQSFTHTHTIITQEKAGLVQQSR